MNVSIYARLAVRMLCNALFEWTRTAGTRVNNCTGHSVVEFSIKKKKTSQIRGISLIRFELFY